MKSRSTLMLLELIIMFLVFSIATALCLKAFAVSDSISKENFARDEAVIIAQNAAELLKYNNGDVDTTKESLKDRIKKEEYELHITPLESTNPYLGKAEVLVTYKNKPVFSITTAWQEVTADE